MSRQMCAFTEAAPAVKLFVNGELNQPHATFFTSHPFCIEIEWSLNGSIGVELKLDLPLEASGIRYNHFFVFVFVFVYLLVIEALLVASNLLMKSLTWIQLDNEAWTRWCSS